MEIVIYVFAGCFILLSAALIFAYIRTRQYGLFLIALTYGTAGVIAIMTSEGWPLLIGFMIAWGLRMLGFDPDTHGKQKQNPPRQS